METECIEKPSLMEMPRAIMIKSGALEEVGGLCRRFHLAGKAIIVCDRITADVAGAKVKDSLQKSGFDPEVMVIQGATDNSVRQVDESIGDERSEFLLGVGGGRPIDVAKYVSTKHDLEFVSVPTAASHDGIASSRASIEMDGRKKSIPANIPRRLKNI